MHTYCVTHNRNTAKAIETNEYFQVYNILLTYFLKNKNKRNNKSYNFETDVNEANTQN